MKFFLKFPQAFLVTPPALRTLTASATVASSALISLIDYLWSKTLAAYYLCSTIKSFTFFLYT